MHTSESLVPARGRRMAVTVPAFTFSAFASLRFNFPIHKMGQVVALRELLGRVYKVISMKCCLA